MSFREMKKENPEKFSGVMAKVAAANRRRLGERKNGMRQRGESNSCAKAFSIESPEGQVYSGKCICDFVRNHKDLFAPQDLVEKPLQRIGGYTQCNAMTNLIRLRPGIKQNRLSWKGWTWVSIQERRFKTKS